MFHTGIFRIRLPSCPNLSAKGRGIESKRTIQMARKINRRKGMEYASKRSATTSRIRISNAGRLVTEETPRR
jgi:hypothetical protein